MSEVTPGGARIGIGGVWPADVVHVNEDGWVLVNRGRRHGVVPGLRLLVVGTGIRELRDLFPTTNAASAPAPEQPVALRIRRTYEQLEVVYTEDACAVAIATRTPPQRRPSFYRGPEGELLVWVPLPEGFTYPQPGSADATPPPTDDGASDSGDYDATGDPNAAAGDTDDADDDEEPDTPPEHGEQDDERWEEALPLNGVAVGDLVVPAIPVASGTAPSLTPATTTESPTPLTGDPPANPFESGRSYDWMHNQD